MITINKVNKKPLKWGLKFMMTYEQISKINFEKNSKKGTFGYCAHCGCLVFSYDATKKDIIYCEKCYDKLFT